MEIYFRGVREFLVDRVHNNGHWVVVQQNNLRAFFSKCVPLITLAKTIPYTFDLLDLNLHVEDVYINPAWRNPVGFNCF